MFTHLEFSYFLASVESVSSCLLESYEGKGTWHELGLSLHGKQTSRKKMLSQNIWLGAGSLTKAANQQMKNGNVKTLLELHIKEDLPSIIRLSGKLRLKLHKRFTTSNTIKRENLIICTEIRNKKTSMTMTVT